LSFDFLFYRFTKWRSLCKKKSSSFWWGIKQGVP